MKDYYSILQVRRFAGSAEIKRSYRLLVQKFHPDVNPHPSAADLIRQINEAYEVLGDPQKKIEYDNLLIKPYQSQQASASAPHRDPRYRKGRPLVKEENRQLELIRQYVHLAVKISWVGCLVCSFLLVDYCFPRHVIHDSIRSLYKITVGRTQTFNVVGESSGQIIKVSYKDFNELERDRPFDIIETGITSTTLEIYFPEKDYHIRTLATIYRNYVFVPILLLITSVMCLVIRDKVEFKFNLGIVTFILLIFALILILK